MIERKVEEYQTVVSSLSMNVDKEVMRLLSEEWELYGHPYSESQCGQYCQAMVRYEEQGPMLAAERGPAR